MNAHKFVAERGIEEAKRVLSRAPNNATHIAGSMYLKLIGAGWWQAWLQEWNHSSNSMTRAWKGESIELIKKWGDVFNLNELKQVVESLDIIDRLFGLDQAKHTMKIAKEIGYSSDYEQIKQAISDYELVDSFKKSTLVEYLDECEQIVNSWPKWKKESMQNAFGFGGKNKKCEVLDMVDVSPRCEVKNG